MVKEETAYVHGGRTNLIAWITKNRKRQKKIGKGIAVLFIGLNQSWGKIVSI